MESTSINQFSSEQISDLLQSLLKNIVTKDDLKHFATRDDISQLEHSFQSTYIGETLTGTGGIDEQLLQRMREQIKENQQAVDKLFQDMTNNKKVLVELKSAVQSLSQEIAGLRHEMTELNTLVVKTQTDSVSRHAEMSELVHNVDASTRVIGKMASVVTDINERMTTTLTNGDLTQFRSEIIQRLDHIVKRIEIYDHEQVSIKVGMKRMEKIQKDESARNDKQDEKIKKAMEKIEEFTYKVNQGGK